MHHGRVVDARGSLRDAPIIIEVPRPGCDGGVAVGHKSEEGISDAAAVIINDGTVAELAAKFDALVQQVTGGF